MSFGHGIRYLVKVGILPMASLFLMTCPPNKVISDLDMLQVKNTIRDIITPKSNGYYILYKSMSSIFYLNCANEGIDYYLFMSL